MKRVVIIGGGFGGLTAAQALKNSNVEIILIDKTNHHLFQPLLYQVATAALSPADIAAPIRGILGRQKNVTVIMGEVNSIDRTNKTVKLNGKEIYFDYLVVAVGARHSYFGNNEWEKFAPGLKTLDDALSIREKILLAYEKAEYSNDPYEMQKYMTFVVVGGGPTGVEMAGAISEIANKSMIKDFRKIDPSKTKVILVEAADRILTSYDKDLSDKAGESLKKLRVIIKKNTMVTDINEEGVWLGKELLPAFNVIWAAGNTIPEITESLNTKLDKAGRVVVNKDCSIEEDENIFIIGDAACFYDNNGKILPGVSPVAMQQGRYVAKIIKKNIPKELRKPFQYFDKGNMATIGRAKAIMQIEKIKISGFTAWLAWCFVYILFLIGFRNKYKVMAEWIWHYITYKHGIRLITKNVLM